MKKIQLILATLLVVLGIEGATNNIQAHASSSTTTPKSLRGTWYKYTGDGKFSTIKITTHSLTYNGSIYSPSKSGAHKLKVGHINSKLVSGGLGTHLIKDPHHPISVSLKLKKD
ncbi:hypothetical protein [Lentilactobacillus hilgardii]|uniref:hypothetical protein n=1 Tax=Lentilactobacillus hilgardii TaxID=1588 RepID=UPI0039EBB0EA